MRRPQSKLKKVRDLGNHGLCSSPQPALAPHSAVVALTTGRIRPGMRLGRSLPPLVNTMSYLPTRCSALFSFHPHYRIANPGLCDMKEDAQERTRPGKARSVPISRTVCWGFAKNTTRMIRSTCQMSVKLLVLWMLTCTDKTKRLTKCPFLLESSSRCPEKAITLFSRQQSPSLEIYHFGDGMRPCFFSGKAALGSVLHVVELLIGRISNTFNALPTRSLA